MYALGKLPSLLFGRSVSDLHEAVKKSDVETVRFLLEPLTPDQKYEMLTVQNSRGSTALHSAALRGQTDTAQVLLSNLTPEDQLTLLRIQDSLGYTALHWAALAGQTDTIGVLLSSLTPERQLTLLKVQDSEARTALHRAVWRGQTDTVKVLLGSLTPEHQLTLIDVQDKAGRSPRDLAIELDHPEIGACLQEIRDSAEDVINRSISVVREVKQRIGTKVEELEVWCAQRVVHLEEQLDERVAIVQQLEEEGNIPYALKKQCYDGIVRSNNSSETFQLTDLGVVVELYYHPEFAVDTQSTTTFLTYPYHSATSSLIHKLTEAGYFYIVLILLYIDTYLTVEEKWKQTKKRSRRQNAKTNRPAKQKWKHARKRPRRRKITKSPKCETHCTSSHGTECGKHLTKRQQNPDDCSLLGHEDAISRLVKGDTLPADKDVSSENHYCFSAAHTASSEHGVPKILQSASDAGRKENGVDTEAEKASYESSKQIPGERISKTSYTDNVSVTLLTDLTNSGVQLAANERQKSLPNSEEVCTAEWQSGGKLIAIPNLAENRNTAPPFVRTNLNVIQSEACLEVDDNNLHPQWSNKHDNRVGAEESIIIGLVADENASCIENSTEQVINREHFEYCKEEVSSRAIQCQVSCNEDVVNSSLDEERLFDRNDVEKDYLNISEQASDGDGVDDDDIEDDDNGDDVNVDQDGRRLSDDGDIDDENGNIDDVKVDDDVDEGWWLVDGGWWLVVDDENGDYLVDEPKTEENINLTVKVTTVEEPDERDNQIYVASLKKQLLETAAENCALSVEEDALTTVNQEVNETLSVTLKDHQKKGEEDISPGSRGDDDRWHDDLLYEVRDILKGEVVCHAVKYSPERFAAVYHVEYHKYVDPKPRLLSYKDWNNSVMPSLECCEAGFFSTNNGDEIVCFQCLLGLRNFTERVDAIAIHQTHSYNFKCAHLEKINRTLMFTTTYEFTILAPKPSVIPQTFPSSGAQTELSLVTTNIGGAGLDLTGDISQLERMSEYERYKLFEEPRRKKKKNVVAKVEYLPAVCDLKYEISRRQTFANNAFISPATAKRLAADGFFLSKNKISCVFCSHSYEVYEAVDSLDDVLTRHHKNSSSANRACLEREGNIPYVLKKQCYEGIVKSKDTQTSDTSQLAQLGVVVERSKHPEFAVDTRRTATFLTYPYHSATSSRTEELAEAGYYYSGEEDSVTCFSCGVTSSKWEPEEGVWQRHARSSTRCQFVLAQKGAGFIAQTLETSGEYHAPRVENKINSVTTRTLRPRWDSNVVQGALDLRQEREKVKTVVNNRIMKGTRDFVLMADIVREISELPKPDQDLTTPLSVNLPDVSHPPKEMEEIEPESHKFTGFEENEEEKLEQQEPTVEETVAGTRMEDSDDIIGQSDNIGDQTDGPESNPEIFRQIASQLTCKICLSSAVGIIFLPCGHLVSCTSCAAALLQCPICRSDVNGTVRVNF